jgi:hypothetical protein
MNDLKTEFARIDSENNVYVLFGDTERKVGQYPNVSQQAALDFFIKKFIDLESQVRILEQRVAKKVDSHLLKKAAEKLAKELIEPNAVGDIASLQARVESVSKGIESLVEAQKNENQASNAASVKKREEIATAAEKIISGDLSKIQWKNASAEMSKLFEQWQAEQKANPKIPKSISEPIWKRFSTARNKFETEKRAFFAKLSANTKASKNAKLELIKRAEKLASKPESTTREYQELLSEWKATGKSVGKADEELWLKFKAFGDEIYKANKEKIQAENEEFSKNLQLKLELVKEASLIDPTANLESAKNSLLQIQQKWEKIGKVPREKVREIEEKLRLVERKVKEAEQELWRKTDPAAQARTNSVIEQLGESIAKLELQLAEATKAKDSKKIKEAETALAARKSWLEVVLASSK